MEFFFHRLEKYIDVRPSAAMKDIIVKIMVEVLSILGIVTKEVKQGRTSMSFFVDIPPAIDLLAERYLKRLIGRRDIENALQRLDKLTQEEVRRAVVESLAIARGIDDTVKVVDEKVDGVNERMQAVNCVVEGVDHTVKDVDHTVKDVDHKVKTLGHRMKGIGHVMKGIGHTMEGVDHTVQGIDDKVGFIKGQLFIHQLVFDSVLCL
jgi:hypothetical protein